MQMMTKTKGFALLQALFFMMFIMAVIAVGMMMSAQRATGTESKRMATDAYPALGAFLQYAQKTMTTTGSLYGSDYFRNYPLSNDYITQTLIPDGFSDPSKCDNTAECGYDENGILVSGTPNLTITVSQS